MRLLKILFAVLFLSLLVVVLLFIYSTNNHTTIGKYEAWYEGVNTNPANDDVKVQFVGVSTLVISDDSTTIMTDGFFSRPPAWDMLAGKIEPEVEDINWAVDKLNMDKLDALLVVHSHFDHAMDAPEVARLTGAPMYGSESTANIGRGWGLPEEQIRLLEDGQPLQFGKFKVTPILSNHYVFADPEIREQALGGNQVITEPLVPPVPLMDYKMGGAYTFLFEHPKGSFLLQSSAGWKEGTLDSIQVDKIILGIGGLGMQTEEYQETYVKEIVDKVEGKQIYVIHWDAFSGSIREPINAPSLFLTWYMGSVINDFEAIEREVGKRPGLKVSLLPQWEKVKL